MNRVLYIEASPLKQRSHTIAAANAFLAAYREHNPRDLIETIDLWDTTLPPFDSATIEAKFAVLRKQVFTPEQEQKWLAVRTISSRFNAADKYVFGIPMWNFGVPYPLKHYIDVVTLANENWSWSRAEGYRALLSGKKALLIYSSAGDYPLAQPSHRSDFQKPYMRRWLDFIGVRDLREINVAPTLTDPAPLAEAKQRAHAEAIELARTF
jgi:FMN-dependent NADH-azoreductase